jgi:glutamine synthetase type III
MTAPRNPLRGLTPKMRAYLERVESVAGGVGYAPAWETSAVAARERGLVRWRTRADPVDVLTACGRHALYLARQSEAKRAARAGRAQPEGTE